jgi:hypothetical protein
VIGCFLGRRGKNEDVVRSPTVTNFKKLIKWMNYLYAKHVVCEQRARDEKQRERGEHCSGLLSFISCSMMRRYCCFFFLTFRGRVLRIIVRSSGSQEEGRNPRAGTVLR